MNSLQVKDKGCESCEFQQNLSILREIDFFSELPLETLKILAYLCTREEYKKGDYLISKGEDDGQAFYVVSGKVGLLYDERNSGGGIIREFGAGKFVGGLSLLGKMRRLFYLKALEDVTCIRMTREKFSKALAQFPELTPKLFQAVVNRILKWEERMFLEHGCHSDTCSHIAGVSLV